MDFIDQLRVLATRISTTRALIQTEEATKNAMVMPLIQILGYNVFDPLEVTPEIVADVGIKKGEKVDYAILRDGKPIILFECKKAGAELNINHASQLFRYFHVTAARFGVLTNGLVYRFSLTWNSRTRWTKSRSSSSTSWTSRIAMSKN
ncbi:type I restriction endonuclease [Xanthomonas hortorum]|uniref:type I restriction endonuclease n=1 Tax=Xanthomonas hortorum TaxID=56454 RepID=UPI0021159C1E|nr:type I restriction endonuclease [Xanthomonas hortorum]UUF04213.1 type I restriction endonuclease [Xanthomonas hortorum pv. pelargonii]